MKVATAGKTIDSGDLHSAATLVVTHRLQRANVHFSSFGANAQGLLIALFPDNAPEGELQSAGAAATAPTDAAFRKVLGLADSAAGGSTSFASAPEVTQALATKFSGTSCESVGDVLIPGTSISAYTVTSAEMNLELNSDGTQLLTTLSSGLVGRAFPDNQIALMVGNEVTLAPTLNSVITNGRLTISVANQSHFDPALVESELALATHDVSLSIDRIQTKK